MNDLDSQLNLDIQMENFKGYLDLKNSSLK